ncbi:MAG: DUF547 domain-containing protein [Verrucomicrobiales bacterium]
MKTPPLPLSLAFKALAALACMAVAPHAAAQDPSWQDLYDGLLKKYVTDSGVKYKAWHADAADRKSLGGVVWAIGRESLAGKSRDEKLAFYLNAYNAWILHEILSDYPTGGPGGGGFFGRNKFFKSREIKVAGKATTFHDLENEIIRPAFHEPRIHFALNCASASCPPLRAAAFRADTLDATLDQLTRAFVSENASGVAVEGGDAEVSKIFDWYEDDFEGAGGVRAFINKYRRSPLPADADIDFQDYDWSLNAAK